VRTGSFPKAFVNPLASIVYGIYVSVPDTLTVVQDSENDPLPRPLQTLFGLRGDADRKRGLSVERIVEAAIELADADGLAAVSMSRVAERVGFTTMALYRHVDSKDELLTLMIDRGVAPPAVLDERLDDWRAELARWCREILAVLERHPWALQVPISGPLMGPNQLTWLDRGLRALTDTPLTEPEKAATILLLNGYAFWQARLSIDVVQAMQRTELPAGAGPTPFSTLVSRDIDPERLPSLQRALDAGIFDDESADTDFLYGLDRILDGVERLIEQRA
jgi:AcrR family transcriptional regulator